VRNEGAAVRGHAPHCGEQFAHGRDDSDLARFASGPKAFVEMFRLRPRCKFKRPASR
jgi:hypothetical protein